MTTPDRDPSEVLDRIRAALLEVEAEVTARIRDALTIAQEVNDADDPEADELRDG